MLKYLYDLIVNFANAIASLVTFVINLISSLVRFIVMIPQYLAQMISVVGLMPAILIPFAVASVTVGVVQYILNRKA